MDEYADSLGAQIEQEIERAIKAEVRSVIAGVVKQHVDQLRDRIARMMREIPSQKLDDYLLRMSREGFKG